MKTHRILLIICLAFAASVGAQTKYYVKTNGYGSGKTWNLASNNLQAIVDAASPGDSVFVAIGTYNGGFFMREGIIVQGGYTANTSIPNERIDVQTASSAQQSILDGEGKQRVITQYSGFTRPTTWNGFVIQNGKPSQDVQVGSIVYSNNSENVIVGVLYKYDAGSGQGMMIGTEEIRKQWGGYLSEISDLQVDKNEAEAKADFSGLANSAKILEFLLDKSIDFSTPNYGLTGNYAALWCDTLQSGGYSEWHLPSIGELQDVFGSTATKTMKDIGKELKNGYWSSSQVGNTLAWAYYFECAHLLPSLKYKVNGVRAVHEYTLQPNDLYSAGGGVLLSKNGILKNCIVENNESSTLGGGVYVGRGAALENCAVEGNTAPTGKEIYYEAGNVGIRNVLKNKSVVQIYPNPVKAGEDIEFLINKDNMLPEQMNVRIWSTTGKIVSTENISGTAMKAPECPGIYFIQLQPDNAISKLVVY